MAGGLECKSIAASCKLALRITSNTYKRKEKEMEETRQYFGRMAYEAYCKQAGGKSAVTGDTLPSFYKTPDAVQEAWIAAALAIKNHIQDGINAQFDF